LLISDPRDFHSPALIRVPGMQWMGTSNFERYGDRVPRYFRLMHEERGDQAFDIFWRIQPAQLARLVDMQAVAGANFTLRLSWTYQGWINGFDGGPLLLPVNKLTDAQAHRLRVASSIPTPPPEGTGGDRGEFYVGRHLE
jgi:4-hydroxy-tetrahydrodipicolinate synthase